jgi:hypothetical protein
MEARPMDDDRRCRAHSTRSGERCRKAAILGGVVCATHGGSAPQVRRRADERLRDLQPSAVLRLQEALDAIQRQLDRHGLVVDVGPDHAIRVRTAQAILDRTGMGPSKRIDVNDQAGERLLALMRELEDRETKQVENEATVTYTLPSVPPTRP